MHPIKTENSNFMYTGPTPEIMDLPCEREVDRQGQQTAVSSVWKPTGEERDRIMRGENIKLVVYTRNPVAPVWMEVVSEREVP